MPKQKKNGARIFGYTFAAIVIVLFVVFAVIPGIIPNSVCVSRSVNGDKVDLTIDVSSLRKPSSFMIEETYPTGINMVSSNVQPLFSENVTSKTSWLFWRGAQPIQDQVLTYTLSKEANPTGYLIAAKSPFDLDKGYNKVEITSERSCI